MKTIKLGSADFAYGYFDGSGVHWTLTDAIGSIELVVSGDGRVEQHTGYYPYGQPWRAVAGQQRLFGGKELRTFAGLNDYDFHARFQNPAGPFFQSADRHAANTPALSPHIFAAANPVRFCDPTGLDWKYANRIDRDSDGNITSIQIIEYTDCTSQSQMDKMNEDGVYIDAIVIVFDGSMNEQLGTKNGNEGYIDGDDAIAADVTVYGKEGPNDIGKYLGYTMSSNFNKYGAIADGTYSLYYRTPKIKESSKYEFCYYLENGGPIPCVGGINPNPKATSKTHKTGVAVHRTNRDGRANGNISEGCLLIHGSQWERFRKQVGNGINNTKLGTVILSR